jgi:hypothetical protein
VDEAPAILRKITGREQPSGIRPAHLNVAKQLGDNVRRKRIALCLALYEYGSALILALGKQVDFHARNSQALGDPESHGAKQVGDKALKEVALLVIGPIRRH